MKDIFRQNLAKKDIVDLKKRYLIWLYKTTKEILDRINRKYTQIDIDKTMFQQIKRSAGGLPDLVNKDLEKHLQDLSAYIDSKEKTLFKISFGNNTKEVTTSDYIFLNLKLKSIVSQIKKLKGVSFLKFIEDEYQKEMISRIFDEKEVGRI